MIPKSLVATCQTHHNELGMRLFQGVQQNQLEWAGVEVIVCVKVREIPRYHL